MIENKSAILLEKIRDFIKVFNSLIPAKVQNHADFIKVFNSLIPAKVQNHAAISDICTKIGKLIKYFNKFKQYSKILNNQFIIYAIHVILPYLVIKLYLSKSTYNKKEQLQNKPNSNAVSDNDPEPTKKEQSRQLYSNKIFLINLTAHLASNFFVYGNFYYNLSKHILTIAHTFIAAQKTIAVLGESRLQSGYESRLVTKIIILSTLALHYCVGWPVAAVFAFFSYRHLCNAINKVELDTQPINQTEPAQAPEQSKIDNTPIDQQDKPCALVEPTIIKLKTQTITAEAKNGSGDIKIEIDGNGKTTLRITDGEPIVTIKTKDGKEIQLFFPKDGGIVGPANCDISELLEHFDDFKIINQKKESFYFKKDIKKKYLKETDYFESKLLKSDGGGSQVKVKTNKVLCSLHFNLSTSTASTDSTVYPATIYDWVKGMPEITLCPQIQNKFKIYIIKGNELVIKGIKGASKSDIEELVKNCKTIAIEGQQKRLSEMIEEELFEIYETQQEKERHFHFNDDIELTLKGKEVYRHVYSDQITKLESKGNAITIEKYENNTVLCRLRRGNPNLSLTAELDGEKHTINFSINREGIDIAKEAADIQEIFGQKPSINTILFSAEKNIYKSLGTQLIEQHNAADYTVEVENDSGIIEVQINDGITVIKKISGKPIVTIQDTSNNLLQLLITEDEEIVNLSNYCNKELKEHFSSLKVVRDGGIIDMQDSNIIGLYEFENSIDTVLMNADTAEENATTMQFMITNTLISDEDKQARQAKILYDYIIYVDPHKAHYSLNLIGGDFIQVISGDCLISYKDLIILESTKTIGKQGGFFNSWCYKQNDKQTPCTIYAKILEKYRNTSDRNRQLIDNIWIHFQNLNGAQQYPESLGTLIGLVETALINTVLTGVTQCPILTDCYKIINLDACIDQHFLGMKIIQLLKDYEDIEVISLKSLVEYLVSKGELTNLRSLDKRFCKTGLEDYDFLLLIRQEDDEGCIFISNSLKQRFIPLMNLAKHMKPPIYIMSPDEYSPALLSVGNAIENKRFVNYNKDLNADMLVKVIKAFLRYEVTSDQFKQEFGIDLKNKSTTTHHRNTNRRLESYKKCIIQFHQCKIICISDIKNHPTILICSEQESENGSKQESENGSKQESENALTVNLYSNDNIEVAKVKLPIDTAELDKVVIIIVNNKGIIKEFDATAEIKTLLRSRKAKLNPPNNAKEDPNLNDDIPATSPPEGGNDGQSSGDDTITEGPTPPPPPPPVSANNHTVVKQSNDGQSSSGTLTEKPAPPPPPPPPPVSANNHTVVKQSNDGQSSGGASTEKPAPPPPPPPPPSLPEGRSVLANNHTVVKQSNDGQSSSGTLTEELAAAIAARRLHVPADNHTVVKQSNDGRPLSGALAEDIVAAAIAAAARRSALANNHTGVKQSNDGQSSGGASTEKPAPPPPPPSPPEGRSVPADNHTVVKQSNDGQSSDTIAAKPAPPPPPPPPPPPSPPEGRSVLANNHTVVKQSNDGQSSSGTLIEALTAAIATRR